MKIGDGDRSGISVYYGSTRTGESREEKEISDGLGPRPSNILAKISRVPEKK
jgi:hypothetical protein